MEALRVTPAEADNKLHVVEVNVERKPVQQFV